MSVKADSWMPLYIGDYTADTMHLTTLEHGAYMLLLMHYWRTGPLPDDDRVLAGIARVDRKIWAKEVAPTIRQFFTVRDGTLRQKRLDAERAKADAIATKRQAAANARWASERSPPVPPDGESKSNANAPANALQAVVQNGMQTALQRAGAVPSQSPRQEESVAPHARADARGLIPDSEHHPPGTIPPPSQSRPAKGAVHGWCVPPDTWAPLAERWEVSKLDGERHPVVGDYHLDTVAGLVAEACGVWQTDWTPLAGWLRDGIAPDEFLPIMRQIAARRDYKTPRFLSYFERAIREQRAAA